MTSEGPHRPGQEPDEVSPGAGGPAPYGDRPAQPDNGYNAAGPDLGWAPPPPARQNPPAPAWATQSEQQPNPAWGSGATPQPPEPAQPAWANGGGASEPQQPGAWPGNGGAPDNAQAAQWGAQQQGWTPAEQGGPAWAAGAPEQPDWAQAQPAAARGAAQVPPATATWPAQEDPARSGGWNTDSPQDDPARSGGWGGAAQSNPPAGDWRGAESQQPESAQATGWSGNGQQDDPAGSGGWATGAAARDDQPVWTPADQSPQTWGQAAEPTEQPTPGWGQAEPAAARGAAQVPAPAANWPGQDDPARSGGWAAQQQQQAQPGTWGDGADAKQDEAGQPAAWGGAEGRPQQPDWVLSAQDQPTDRPEPAAWTPEQTGTAARASASVPGNDGSPAWAAAPDSASQGSAGVPDAQPWAPGEVWGRAEAEASAQPRGGWEADRGDEPPAYQPGPAPGISPANAVPLPPQEQRVPGASLAAAPPVDYASPAPFAAIPEQPSYAERETPDAAAQYEAEPAAWGRAEESPAGGAVVPAPRTSPESGAGRAVVPAQEAESAAGAVGRASASASVPLASRVMPPTDQAIRPTGTSAPQPRVYGRPAQPEPEQAAPEAFQADPGPERQGTPDWQNGAARQAAPDWQNGPDRQAAPDWQNGPERQGAPDWQNGPDRQGGPGWGGDSPAEPRFDDRERPSAPNGFEAASAPPAFPPGVPSFVDAPGNNRPVNGVRPQAGAERPENQYGPGSPAAGSAGVNGAPGFGGPGFGGPPEPAPGAGFTATFPPAPQQAAPSWGQQAGESDHNRFEAFKPDADEPKAEPPVPKVRNGRVLAAVLIAAVLILAVPLGLLMLLGKFGGGDEAPAFDPAVGTCVKQSGQGASATDCGEAGAFTIVSKVDAKDKCTDTTQPHVVLPGDGTNRVLCLKPATK
ncbi:LppU/SCO3897 family protein [Micromonospora sp. ZYX-F-536]|uniref:LppU/SCO3897 family protein n=1 Tax=Micromonospora sp. ZYX-F-536 TaxID=3457629 RepID=UPI004040A860